MFFKKRFRKMVNMFFWIGVVSCVRCLVFCMFKTLRGQDHIGPDVTQSDAEFLGDATYQDMGKGCCTKDSSNLLVVRHG